MIETCFGLKVNLQSSDPDLKTCLTLSCPDSGLWRESDLRTWNLQDLIRTNPDPVLPVMEGLQEFTEYLSECLEPPSPFELLEPPGTVGFLKLCRPCCYLFPGGAGGSAFFAVNGFNLLVNGGSDARSCFWKLVRHLDRIDSVLLTHLGVDNLPGLNSLLLRKLSERDQQASGPVSDEDLTQNLVSPELGVVFFNAPSRLRSIQPDPGELRSSDQAALTLQLLQQLGIKPQPLSRPGGPTVEPLILFQKMGVGRLELYVLNPVSGTKDLEALMQLWPDGGAAGKTRDVPLPCLASTCALLVWHPSSPSDKIVRVLFPGCTPQTRILDGLEKLKHLAFLKQPSVCLKDLQEPKRAESRESLKSKDLRPSSASQKDKPAQADAKKHETKTKPKSAGEDPDAKPKTKISAKKETSKEEKKDPKKEEKVPAEVTKKTSLNVKKDARVEPKKDVRAEEKKPVKSSLKEAKRSSGSPDQRKASGKGETSKKDVPMKNPSTKGAKDRTRSKDHQKKLDPFGRLDGENGNSGSDGTPANQSQTSTRESPELFRSLAADQRTCSGKGDFNENFDLSPSEGSLIRTGSEEKTLELVSAAGSAPNSVRHGPVHRSDHNQRGSCRRSDLSSQGEVLKNSTSCQDGQSGPLSSVQDPLPDSPLPMSSTSSMPFSNGDVRGSDCRSTQNGLINVQQVPEVLSEVPHDVDLCLVSPCEFQHPRAPENQQQDLIPGPTAASSPDLPKPQPCSQDQMSGDGPSASSQETPPTSLSHALPTDSDSAPCTSAADLDSEEDLDSIFLHRAEQLPSHDPPPAPVKDLPPLPPQPGTCMADPEADKTLKTSGARFRPLPRTASGSSSAQSGKSKTTSSGSLKTNLETKTSCRSSPGGSRAAPARPQSSGRPGPSRGTHLSCCLNFNLSFFFQAPELLVLMWLRSM